MYTILNRRKVLENESTQDEEIKKKIYHRIDSGLSASFIGGTFLGLAPLLISKNFSFLGWFLIGSSLFFFFAARYFSLRFLFNLEE